VTSAALCTDGSRLLAGVEASLLGGARLVQYRNKGAAPAVARAHAGTLAGLCRHFGAELIVNDDVDLALEVGAGGVHLGASDGSIALARRRLGAAAIIGASCGSSLQRAIIAADQGASYVAFGRFFASRTKPDAAQASIEVLGAASARLRMPICAIGGVTPGNGGPLIAAGASLLAAVEGVFGGADLAAIRSAAVSYSDLFKPGG
jgi:thiamine-phosphate pyrophosphorylase